MADFFQSLGRGLAGAAAGQRDPAGMLQQQRRIAQQKQSATLATYQMILENTSLNNPVRAKVIEKIEAIRPGMGQMMGQGLFKAPAKAEPFSLGPGHTRFDPSGKEIASVPAAAPTPRDTAAERRRSRLLDLRVKEQQAGKLGPRETQEKLELEKEQTKATTIVGRTEEDLAVRDPVRARRLKTFIEKNSRVKTELVDLMGDIEEFPQAVGGIAGGRETAGGLIGQVGDLLDNDKMLKLAEMISPDQLTAIRTKAATLRTALLPTMTGDESRYTDRDMALVTENLKVLSTAASARQAVVALSNIAAVVNARDADARTEFSEGFGRTFLEETDIERGRFQVGNVYSDANGNQATYLGGNPSDPKSWRENGGQ